MVTKDATLDNSLSVCYSDAFLNTAMMGVATALLPSDGVQEETAFHALNLFCSVLGCLRRFLRLVGGVQRDEQGRRRDQPESDPDCDPHGRGEGDQLRLLPERRCGRRGMRRRVVRGPHRPMGEGAGKEVPGEATDRHLLHAPHLPAPRVGCLSLPDHDLPSARDEEGTR